MKTSSTDASTNAPHSPVRYQIPTHLTVPDRIAIPLFGITFHVTIRQGFIYIVGGSIAFHVWQQCAFFSEYGLAGTILRLCVPLLLAIVTLVVAVVQIGERYLETWAVLLTRYRRYPHLFLWEPVSSVSSVPSVQSETGSTEVIAENADKEGSQTWF
jgi:hypothetical protein